MRQIVTTAPTKSHAEPREPLQDNESAAADLEVDNLIARTIGCPTDRGGLVVAMRQVTRCLAAATQVLEPKDVLVEWHAASVGAARRLREEATDQPQLLTHSVEMHRLPIYGQLLTLPQTEGVCAQRAFAILGRAIAASACTGEPLPVVLVDGVAAVVRTLGGAARSVSWKAIASSLPLEVAAIRALIDRTGRSPTRTFLVALLATTTLRIESPQQARAGKSTRTPSASRTREEPNDTPDDETDTGDHDQKVQSFVGWLIQRSNFVGLRSRFAVTRDWGVLTERELREICALIALTAASSGAQRHLALLAIVSLLTSLPARLAMNLPLQPSTDMWFDVGSATLWWCLVRVTDADRAREITADEVAAHELIDIPLPTCGLAAVKELRNSGAGASTFGELLAGSRDDAEFRRILVHYRRWLRSLGADSKHGVLDARFAQSLSQVYRAQTGDVVTALLALDFRECALGMLHYVALPRSFLHEQVERVYQRLGLGSAVASAA